MNNKANILKAKLTSVISVIAIITTYSQCQASEVVKVYEKNINNKSYCVSEITVNTSPINVWKIITNYNQANRVFPRLKECELLKSQGNVKIVRHSLNPSGMPTRFNYIVEVTENYGKELTWHRKSGDFKEVDGFWRLESLNNGKATNVVYASHVIGTFLQPEILIKRQCKMDMPSTMIALKTTAESTNAAGNSREIASKMDSNVH